MASYHQKRSQHPYIYICILYIFIFSPRLCALHWQNGRYIRKRAMPCSQCTTHSHKSQNIPAGHHMNDWIIFPKIYTRMHSHPLRIRQCCIHKYIIYCIYNAYIRIIRIHFRHRMKRISHTTHTHIFQVYRFGDKLSRANIYTHPMTKPVALTPSLSITWRVCIYLHTQTQSSYNSHTQFILHAPSIE